MEGKKEGKREERKGRREGLSALIYVELVGNSHLFMVNESNYLYRFDLIPGRNIVLGHMTNIIIPLDRILAELPFHLWVCPPASVGILGDHWIGSQMYRSQRMHPPSHTVLMKGQKGLPGFANETIGYQVKFEFQIHDGLYFFFQHRYLPNNAWDIHNTKNMVLLYTKNCSCVSEMQISLGILYFCLLVLDIILQNKWRKALQALDMSKPGNTAH